jgi:hypothetical protein
MPEGLHGASQTISDAICPENLVHSGLCLEISPAELTHQKSGKCREGVLISTARACSMPLKFCMEPLKPCPEKSVHSGSCLELSSAELTHQKFGKCWEGVLVSTARACLMLLKFFMEPLKPYYMLSSQNTQCTQVCVSKYVNVVG